MCTNVVLTDSTTFIIIIIIMKFFLKIENEVTEMWRILVKKSLFSNNQVRSLRKYLGVHEMFDVLI